MKLIFTIEYVSQLRSYIVDFSYEYSIQVNITPLNGIPCIYWLKHPPSNN